MKIKKFEAYEEYSDDYNYEFGGHVFVLARYKKGWDKFEYNTSFKDNEFVPCMISGNPSYKWQRRNFCIFGHSSSYDINNFEILKGSDKSIQELISTYTSAKKFNI